MKKICLCLLGVVLVSFSLTGCGSSGGGSSSATPSTAALPFGIESMSLPTDDERRMVLDFTYNSSGDLIEATSSQEEDWDGDGRTDSITRTVVTLDPSLTAIDMPDLEIGSPKSARSATGVDLAKVSSPVTLVSDFLPGTVVKVVTTRHGYGGSRAATTIPDYMILEDQETMTFTYDAAGRLLEVTTVGEDYRRLETVTQTFTWDQTGNLLFEKLVAQFDDYKDGWIDAQFIAETSHTYDEQGNKIKTVRDDYGSSYLETTTYSYDAAGNLVEEDWQHTNRSDGELVDQTLTTYSYDGAGRLLTRVETDYYFGALGVTTFSIETTTYSYDDSDRVTLKVRQYDSGGDSTIETTYTDTYVYGEFGVTSYEYRYDYSGGGYTRSYDYTYNDAGQITSEIYMYDNNSDGADFFDMETYTYDAEGRLLAVATSDHDVVAGEPGPATWLDQTTFAYDEAGRLVEWAEETYADGTNISDRLAITVAYNASETAAEGTMQYSAWDATASELVAVGAPLPVAISLAAGAPTAVMDMPIGTLPYSTDQASEEITLNVSVPALYGVAYGSMFFNPMD